MKTTVTRLVPEYLELIRAWRNHIDIRRFMYTQHEITAEEHHRWFVAKDRDPFSHLLLFKMNDEPYGFVNITQIRQGPVADWGFYVAPEAPKGTGQLLGNAALGFAFGELNLHKICGEAVAFNTRSILFHRKMGFREEGVRVDQHFDGELFHAVHYFGLLQSEWVDIRGKIR